MPYTLDSEDNNQQVLPAYTAALLFKKYNAYLCPELLNSFSMDDLRKCDS